MATLEARRDFHTLLVRFFTGFQHPVKAGWIRREGFFHEDVDPLLHGVLDMHGADVGARGAESDIPGTKRVDRALIRFEAKKLPIWSYVDAIFVHLFERLQRILDLLFVEVGDRVQFDGALVAGVKGIGHGSVAAPTGADQGESDGVILTGECSG